MLRHDIIERTPDLVYADQPQAETLEIQYRLLEQADLIQVLSETPIDRCDLNCRPSSQTPRRNTRSSHF
jgi:hypothetical protein